MEIGKGKSILRFLVAYYGLWQLVHLVLNLWHFFGDGQRSPIVRLVGGSMSAEQFRILEGSGYIDVLIAIPLGLAFSLAFLRGRPWALPLGLVSLTVAVYSAWLSIYLHLLFGTFTWDAVSSLLGYASFVPHVVLWVWLVLRAVRTCR